MTDQTNPAPEANDNPDDNPLGLLPGETVTVTRTGTPGPAESTGTPASSDFYVAPPEGAETGHAVYDVDLAQFVSGVMSKDDAGKARKALQADPAPGESRITDGHKLEVRPV